MNEKYLHSNGTAFYYGVDSGVFNGKPYYRVRLAPSNTSTFSAVDLSCTEEVYNFLLSCAVGCQIAVEYAYSEYRRQNQIQRRLRVVSVEA